MYYLIYLERRREVSRGWVLSSGNWLGILDHGDRVTDASQPYGPIHLCRAKTGSLYFVLTKPQEVDNEERKYA